MLRACRLKSASKLSLGDHSSCTRPAISSKSPITSFSPVWPLLIQLSRRIGFRLAPGFGERVVYRELFLKGLTVLDLPEAEGSGLPPNPSHLAGLAEIRALLQTIGLDEIAAATSGKASA